MSDKLRTTWTVVASASNSTATATKSAPGAGKRLVLTGFSISGSAAPAAAVAASIRSNGGATTLETFQLPASAFAPVVANYVHPLRCAENVDADITLAALGSGVTGTVVLKGFTEYC